MSMRDFYVFVIGASTMAIAFCILSFKSSSERRDFIIDAFNNGCLFAKIDDVFVELKGTDPKSCDDLAKEHLK